MNNFNTNPVAIPAGMTREQLREEIKAAGYTDEQFREQLITVCSYNISIILQMLYKYVKTDCEFLRNHPLCTRTGYKMELKKVEDENERIHRTHNYIIHKVRNRIDIIVREQMEYADLPKALTQLLYCIHNHLNRNFIKEAQLLSHSIRAQTLSDFSMNVIELRLSEVEKVKPIFSERCQQIVPRQLNQYLCDLSSRIALITGNDMSMDGGSINNCQEINTVLHILDNGALDVENLSINSAFALQELHGDKWLHDNDINIWYLLHPTERPEYIAQKQREAEQAERDRLERERIDRELAEAEAARRAEEERDIADRLRDAGWNIKKR